MKKRILTGILILFAFATQFAFAAQKEVTKEYTFVTNKDAEIEFDDIGKGDLSDIPLSIDVDGKTYNAASADFSLAKKPEEITKEFTDLSSKEVDQSIKEDGKIYTLSHVKWTEENRTAIAGTKRYYGYNTKPQTPAEKEITATLPNGNTITVTGKLVGIERVKGDFNKPFSVTAKFIGEPDVENYILPDGSKIPNDETIPVFKGYEDVILKNLGYSTQNYRITGGKWISDYYTDNNGETCREAKFTGTQAGTDWVATYREELTESSPQKTTYEAVATYTADTMTVKAVVTYEREGLSFLLKALIIGSAAVVVLAIFFILILSRIRKNEKQDKEEI